MDQVLSFFTGLLSNSLPCILLALGILITFKILNFADMTAEGSILVGMSICALCIKSQVPFICNPFVATLFGMLAGMVLGAITGVLNRVLKIPSLLSGIITLTMATPIAGLIMGAATGTAFNNQVSITNLPTIYSIFNSSIKYPFKELVEVAVMLVIVLIILFGLYFFFGTEYGMAIRTAGKNEKMAKSQGINTNVACFVGVVISNGLIGLAGSLLVQHYSAVSMTSATGYLVVGLAAILMGDAIFGTRSFKNVLVSVCLGSILYYLIIRLALIIGFPGYLNQLLYALLIVIALCLPMIKKGFIKLFGKFKKKGDSSKCLS